MPLIINTNLSSLNAQRQMTHANQELSQASERLSSGKRINTAADDAAGLVLSNRMTSQIRGLNQAARNAMDGVSMIQVAEGALDESTNILQRIRELAVQGANGIYSDTDRATLDAEVQQLVAEMDRIAESTQFNGQNILDGSQAKIKLQVGAEANQTISFGLQAMDTKSLGFSSLSADLSGDQMDLAANGTLSSTLAFGAVTINGKALNGLATGQPMQKLIDDINQNIDGVSAKLLTTLKAPITGDGVLTGSDAVNITAIDLDGSSTTFSVSNTASLNDLAAAITKKTGNNITASVVDGKLTLTSEKYAALTLQDTTFGSATGVNETNIADPDIAEVMAGLNSSWLREAETLIFDALGLQGDNYDLQLDLVGSDGINGYAAQVSWDGTNLVLNIDMADFTASGDPSGGSPYLYMDRVIAHEMTHAVMFRALPSSVMLNLPKWFIEGAAELVHGGDERVEDNLPAIANQGLLSAVFGTAKITPTTDPVTPISAEAYAAGYLATKMIHDDIIAAGGTGINELFAYLAGGQGLDAALASVKSDHAGLVWSDLASFEADFESTGDAYRQTLNFDVGPETDTGAPSGSDYGNPAKSPESILPNNNVGGPQNFNFIVPDEYAGGLTTATAQLLLTSEDGSEVTIGLGANGTDDDLALLGFREVTGTGEVLGSGLSTTAQNAALNANDLKINGVSIASVAANKGLAAKVDAINAARDQTNVTASIVAKESFELNANPGAEWVTAGGAISITATENFGLNGIAVSVTSGDGANEVAAAINATTDFHGAKAYGDDSGFLHIYSDTAINLSGSGAFGAAIGGGINNTGAAGTGSIEFNGTEITFSDLSDAQTIVGEINDQSSATGVSATIDDNGELELRAASAINVKIGQLNGMRTLAAIGIDFGLAATDKLTDSNSNDRFDDDAYTLLSRIQLDSFNDQAISLELTADGKAATGLAEMNVIGANASGSSLANISVSTVAGAQQAIGVVDQALETINATRSELGAVNNRLSFTVNNLMNTSEKTTAARSRILDADYAAETAALTRADITRQASQAMLAQANSRPQQVLQLLN